jgi:predicted DNA binding protein
MNTVIEVAIPADTLALGDALEAVPDTTFELLRTVPTGTEDLMPFLLAKGPDCERVREALVADPSVAGVETVATLAEECLYEVEWDPHTEARLSVVCEERGAVLQARASTDRWLFRLLFPDRNSVSSTYAHCQSFGISFEVNAIYELTTSIRRDRHGLSPNQYETLEQTLECGFYEVPRETNLQELATQFGVSHQALSERIRRAHGTIVENALVTGLSR